MVIAHKFGMRLGHTGEKSLQAPGKKGSLKGAFTCNIELGGYDVLEKKMKGEIRHHYSPLRRSS